MSPVRALLLALLGLLIAATPARAADPPLVYVVVIDALDGDAVDGGQAPFVASLLRGDDGSNATYWRESRSIMVAETNPNHVAMATGAYGETSGIPGNAFAARGTTDGESCPASTSPGAAPVETSGQSPECLRAETFFQSVQRSAGADSVVTAGIFGKPKLARIFAGRSGGRYDADYLWTPCLNGDTAPYCKQMPARPNDDYALFDLDVMDEVLRTVREGVRGDGKTFTGGGRRPNLTFVNLPGVDSSGHGTGRGAVYDATVGQADAQIQRFVQQQKALGLWGRSVLVLLSDHSMETTPNKSSLTARFTGAGIPSSDYTVVQNGSAAFVYVNDARSSARFVLLKRLREAAIGRSVAPLSGPPATEALYREPNPADGGGANTVAARHPAWRLSASPRIGDLVVTAVAPDGAFNEPNPLTGNHGGPQTRDNFFAVIGGGPLVRRQALAGAVDPLFDDTERNPGQAENVDVAATVTRLLGERAPAQSAGRFLAEAFEPSQLAPPAPAGSDRACAASARIRSVSVKPRGSGLRLGFSAQGRVRIDVFQSSIGRRILGNRRVARFTRRTGFVWRGRGVRNGQVFVRLRLGKDVRRVALARRGGRFHRRPAFSQRASCGAISSFKLERPVFGGRTNRAVDVTYRLGKSARVRLELLRGKRVVRRLAPTKTRTGGRAHRVRISSEGLRRGDYRVRLRAGKAVARLTARRL